MRCFTISNLSCGSSSDNSELYLGYFCLHDKLVLRFYCTVPTVDTVVHTVHTVCRVLEFGQDDPNTNPQILNVLKFKRYISNFCVITRARITKI